MKNHWRKLKNLLLGQFQPHVSKYLWIKGVRSNKGPRPFPVRDNEEIAKIHLQSFKIFSSRITGPISIKFGTKCPWVKGTQDFINKNHFFFLKEMIGLILSLSTLWYNHSFEQMCYLIWTQVSDVDHGSFVLDCV